MTDLSPEMMGLSQRYAQALYRSALETWVEQLSAVRRELVLHSDLRARLNSDSSFAERQQALDAILPDTVSPGVRNFLYVLLREHHLHLLDEIILDLERMIRRGPEVRVARVISAMPLTEEEKRQIQERLIKRFGGDLDFDFRVDPQILGGLIVKVGDEVIDGSLAGKLAAMRAQLSGAS